MTVQTAAVANLKPAATQPAFHTKLVLGIAGAFVALELAVASCYGIHRDELYFLACARHLAWGYVDQPPMVPAIAWLSTHLFGVSAVALRVVPALAGGGAVVLTALMARELGGGRKAQMLAAAAAATSPQLLATFHLLSTAAFDFFFWSALSFVALRFLRTRDDRLLLVFGGLAGLGLMNKLSVAFLLPALGAGMLLSGRGRVLLNRWLWAGIALALVIWSPNIIWNAQHHWAAIAMLRSLHAENGGLGASLGFLPSQLLVVGPLLAVLWIAGLAWVWRSPIAKPFGVAYVTLAAFFVVTGAKSYYLGGMYFVLFAAGAVWAETRWHERRATRKWIALLGIGLLAALPLSLPVLPASALAKSSWQGNINKDLSATVGWPSFVRQFAHVAATLPPGQRDDLVIFTGDYGAAGAIDLYGPKYGLPHAVSGHNNYWWWGPPRTPTGTTTIAVNLSRQYLLTIFANVTPAGTVATPHGVWTEERGDAIWVCRDQKVPWQEAWPAARHYG